MNIKWILLALGLFAVVLSGCGRGFHDRLGAKDVSNQKRFDYWFGKDLVLVQDAFLTRTLNYPGCVPGEYHLVFPKTDVSVPVSVEDYERYPNDWVDTEAYREVFPETRNPNRTWRWEIIEVIPAGTIVRVIEIRERQDPMIGPLTQSYIEIQDPKYEGKPVYIFQSVENWSGSQAHPMPRTEYLQFVHEKDARYAEETIPVPQPPPPGFTEEAFEKEMEDIKHFIEQLNDESS